MNYTIENAVIVITGSSSGIGREAAYLLGKHGAALMLNGRNEKKVLAVAESCKQRGFTVAHCVADISTHTGAMKLIETTIETFGKIDILINNAGISNRGPFISLKPDVAESIMRTNILGYVYPTRYALPHLLQRQGYILFISTVSGICGFPGIAMYSASKMAITSLAQSMHSEYYDAKLRVGIIYLPSIENDPDKTLLTTDGRTITYNRKYAMTQQKAAQHIFRCIKKRRRQRVLTLKGVFAWTVQHYFPRIADWILRNSQGKFHDISRSSKSENSTENKSAAARGAGLEHKSSTE